MTFSNAQRTWIVGCTLVIILVVIGLGLSHYKTLQRFDLLVYDLILPLHSPGMSDQVVIIAIDDASIHELGRWPWSRQRHAELLNKISPLSPKAVAIDLIFSESENSLTADQSLAEAIDKNARTVLVVAPVKETPNSLISERLPIPILATAAAALGHVDVELDIDGLNRHFYLHAGIADPHWPSVALAMLEVSQDKRALIAPPYSNNTVRHHSKGWARNGKVLISYTSPKEKPKRISYADVMADRVPLTDLQDKYILIGATSAGIGDMISTPANTNHQRMPGVEVIAHELNTLLQEKLRFDISSQTQLILTALLIMLCVTAIYILPQRFVIVVTLVSASLIISCSLYLFLCQQLWFDPFAALAMVSIAGPLLSVWRNKASERLTKQLQAKLDKQSREHVITGLPNYAVLQETLYRLTVDNKVSGIMALFIIHINKHESAVSVINRAIGDSILLTISDRLKTALTAQPFITHLNDDDFALILTDKRDINTIKTSANQLLAHLQQPLYYLGEEIILAPNIGISIWPTDSRDSHDLLRKAYTAMFKSRIDENQAICIYTDDIGQEIGARAELEQAMAGALERNEFEVYYQPQVAASSGKLIGAEALLRWHSPDLGWIGPDTFIPVAEQSGLINSIGDWVLKTACNDLKLIKQAGLEQIRIAVNLSPLQFSDRHLADNIAAMLLEADIPPEMLELEVTESTLMNSIDHAVQTMTKIKLQGMSLAIDDFGTGYSSLKHLQSFPLDRIKIDKCFTEDLHNKNSSEITLTIIELAKRLNLCVIAEGIETSAQADFFRNNGCDELQGYLYSKPIPASELIEYIKLGRQSNS